ncbi:MAG: PRTRC system ThiF family protein [Armatimonadota bacterium]
MSAEHTIIPELLQRMVRVHLVGAGGNGAQMLTGLGRLNHALTTLGHPGGLFVTVYDHDTVSASNVGRQLFSEGDLGRAKATVLVHRLNAFYGLHWKAITGRYPESADQTHPDLVITCVDTAAARREIYRHLKARNYHPGYWLDLGNRQTDGQVVLGEQPLNGTGKARHPRKPSAPPALPTVVDLFPDILDERIAEDDRPSCSLAQALESQDLFINDHVSRWALQLLWDLFRKGRLAHHGYFVNLATGRVNPLPVPVPKPSAEVTPVKKARARQ